MGLRVGVGKKVGGVYVGASKTIGGGSHNKKSGGGCWTVGIAILFFPIAIAYLFAKWAYNKTQQQKAIDPESVWYKQTWGIILMLILFFPVGIYLMWKYGRRWNLYVKIAVSVVFGIFTLFAILSPDNKNNADNSSFLLGNSEESVTVEQAPVKYEANDLAKLINEDKEFKESLKGQKIELTGLVKENKLNDTEIYIEGDFKYGGWYQCEMADKSDVNKVNAGDIAVIEGVVEKCSGHLYMEQCVLIRVETPTEQLTTEKTTVNEATGEATEKVTESETEPPTEEPTEAETEPPTEEETEAEETAPATHEYSINYETGKFHKPSCYTIKDSDNIEAYEGTAEELKEMGYQACKKCNPR